MSWVGAYGVAVVILTIIIRLALAPLQQFQLLTQRKTMTEQRKLAPQVAELRKKFKKDPTKLNQEMMKLYQEHGVNPLGGLIGCLPLIVQLPILTALYYVFSGNAKSHILTSVHFLFIQNLNTSPLSHPLLAGLPIPAIAYLIIPLLAAATTFVQSRMMQQPPNPAATEQEQQAQAMTKQMQVFMPLMIAYFAFVTPAGLGLYWFISNCFAIIQQYLVNGWGGLRPPPGAAAAEPATAPRPPARPSRPPTAPARPPRQPATSRAITDPKRPRPRKPKK